MFQKRPNPRKDQAIRISKTLSGTNRKEYDLGTPMTKKSFHIVPIDSNIITMLKNLRVIQDENRITEMKYHPDYLDKGFVFRDSESYPYSAQYLWQDEISFKKDQY
ncbi:hypothetical protein D3C77_641210 [compost metagenome]